MSTGTLTDEEWEDTIKIQLSFFAPYNVSKNGEYFNLVVKMDGVTFNSEESPLSRVLSKEIPP